jgi:membrane-associated phospholipid phosphatase
MRLRVAWVTLFFCWMVSCNSRLWGQSEQPAETHPARPPAQTASSVQGSESERGTDQYGDRWLLPGEDPENNLLLPFAKHLAQDQADFWIKPSKLRVHDLKWALPFAGIAGGLIATDSWLSKQGPDAPSQLKRSKDVSDYATYSLIGLAGGSFLVGHMTGNEHLRETGLLAAEAGINSTAVTYLLKEISQRRRPYQGDHNGTFFQGGGSFPSEHSAVAWSVASVWAHQYPGVLSQVLAYGLASAVTVGRVTSQQHFASDAVIGSALGWYFGRQVYRARHDPGLGGAPWGSLMEHREGAPRDASNMGSPYVPLDSWVYSALERLIAMGYVDSAILGQRPWTRLECARLLEDAEGRLSDLEAEDGEGPRLFEALAAEFAPETRRREGAANIGASLDSVYFRSSNIVGASLRDGYHLGQTIVNDFGRPYGEGFNAVTGVMASAEAGPFAFFIRGEYQHAPATASYGMPVLQAIANADLTLPVSSATAEINRFRLLDSTVSFNFHNYQLSFGKQSLWLGPGESGPLLFSDNADPVLMLKLDSVSPYRVPLLSKIFGPVKIEYFLGQLAGHQFEVNALNTQNPLLGPGNIDPQPFLDGAKLSFKPTKNLELGFGFTAQFVGPGLPFTWGNFLRTFYSHTSGNTTGSDNPGKRIASADVSYRVKNWLTIYLDSLVVDEFSPVGSGRASVNPGIYLPRIPKIPKLEFRAEGVREPLTAEFAPGFVYYGLRRFRSGYTNEGNLMGNWVGRAGRGGQGWLTYWLSPRNTLQAGYRLQEVSADFIGGGRLSDWSAKGDFALNSTIELSGLVQYEQWRFPVIAAGKESNVSASFQIKLYPSWRTSR